MSTEPAISAVIITYNEIKNIERCIDSLVSVCDEILIIDSFSTDGTVELAKSKGCKVHQLEWQGYSASKNRGNQLAMHDWILSLDADECLSPELQSSIAKSIKTQNKVYSLQRITNYCGKWIKHSGWYPDVKPRLFHRDKCHWEGDFVHEKLQCSAAETEVLQGKLLHYSYYSKDEFITREKKYAHLAAARDKDKGITYLGSVLSATNRFIRMYLLKLGILDGREGLEIALISARSKFWKFAEYKKLKA